MDESAGKDDSGGGWGRRGCAASTSGIRTRFIKCCEEEGRGASGGEAAHQGPTHQGGWARVVDKEVGSMHRSGVQVRDVCRLLQIFPSCPLGLATWTPLAHKHFAVGPNTSLAMIMRGGFAGLSKNPPCLQAYFHAFNIYCYIPFDHNFILSCISCTFIITIGLLLKRFRVCLGLLYFSFLSSAPTFCSQTPPPPKTLLQEKVEFWANSTIFLEHLKGYSTNPHFQLPRRFV
jgi:hypothetical protein